MIETMTRLAPVSNGKLKAVYSLFEGVEMKLGGGSGSVLCFLSIKVRRS